MSLPLLSPSAMVGELGEQCTQSNGHYPFDLE